MNTILSSCRVKRSVSLFVILHVFSSLLSLGSLEVTFELPTVSLESQLRRAAVSGDVAKCTLLLSQGAQINAAGTDGFTALHRASQGGHLDVCRLLLDRGANIGTASSGGSSPLMIACRDGHVGVCGLLLDRGANINAVDKNGYSSLSIASLNGHAELCRLLLDRKADSTLKNQDGKTALDHAKEMGHTAVSRILQERTQYGAAPLEGGAVFVYGEATQSGALSGTSGSQVARVLSSDSMYKTLILRPPESYDEELSWSD